jgi:hypothetical protein
MSVKDYFNKSAAAYEAAANGFRGGGEGGAEPEYFIYFFYLFKNI